ncbi:MAG: hypothetical protein VX815_05870, partial [Gemmatimonadota bacterium]|nr:hypothetical protein [Gemmatimonadota bacterium]
MGALAGMVFPLGLLGLVVLSGSRAYPPSPWWASWASLEDLGRLPPLGFSGSLEDRSLWLSPRRGPAKTLGWSAWSRAPR